MKNEPAFPSGDDHHCERVVGMSLRDYFAGQALSGMGSWAPQRFTNLNHEDTIRARAEWAYQQADAMLFVRNQREE